MRPNHGNDEKEKQLNVFISQTFNLRYWVSSQSPIVSPKNTS